MHPRLYESTVCAPPNVQGCGYRVRDRWKLHSPTLITTMPPMVAKTAPVAGSPGSPVPSSVRVKPSPSHVAESSVTNPEPTATMGRAVFQPRTMDTSVDVTADMAINASGAPGNHRQPNSSTSASVEPVAVALPKRYQG